MNIDNSFDRKLDAQKMRIPTDVRDAAIFVTDTLDVCWASARSVFGDDVNPEVAIAIYDRVVDHMERAGGEVGGDE